MIGRAGWVATARPPNLDLDRRPRPLRRSGMAASMKATISRVSRRSIGNCRVSNIATIFLSSSR